MSRILVKNIPANATVESLRVHFSSSRNSASTITDVHVAHKRDGTPRRFAFVGFKTEEQARGTKEWFDGTFWGSQRITVEIVQGVKDAPAPRPNKRPRLTGPEHTTLSSVKPPVESASNKSYAAADKDALTTEFLSVMKPRTKKGPTWADSEIPRPLAQVGEGQGKSPPVTEKRDPDERAKDDVTLNEAVSDLDWMKSRMSKGIGESKAFTQSDDEGDDEHDLPKSSKPDETPNEQVDPQEIARQAILATGRLFVRNLTFSCTSEELQDIFSRFGKIKQVHLLLTPAHTSKGLAFVSFEQPSDAVAAWKALDGTTFQGRLLHILAGIERRKDAALAHGTGNKQTLKEARVESKRRDAGREFNWGMLYMNSDAVVSSIADRMNIPKAELLGAVESEEGVSSQNPAVNLALAETHVIQETKRFFEEQGVVLSTLSARGVPRSRTIILVKNIPYGTTVDTLRELFKSHGEITRLLIPPAGTLAVVEYTHIEDAARAFRAIAYRRLGNSVVYLEWAPEGLLVENSTSGRNGAGIKPVEIRQHVEDERNEEDAIRSGSTLYIKNLAFATTSERLTQVFRSMPSFVFARVQTKPSPNNTDGQERLSMGYGFVGFKDAGAAKHALQSMHGFVLDGHKLHVTFAGRGADDAEVKGAEMVKMKTAKMIVKNVPFEATKKDLRDLFGVYGTLKSVRLPKKFDARSRGFAFLEFVSRQEAEKAFAALRHTHLLGRHLVLDWATEGTPDIETLRQKVGIGFGEGGAVPGQKRKLEMDVDEEENEEQ